ncbi:hypothetical protein J2Z83_003153 [Virgibacillus natechei]|uniref:SpoIIIAH-like family protein n=1 Tax=Virgibacillus natechei TaxID=1216297 RepID=A0ABS4IL18_9BACI|nr:hypothetical protein [Virgibacillus natechei]MBP1971016.1 hypothetical protein [Virgibacillus natechei]UZD12773.1 hypothetical protein OLD84_18085 [Virgibacillus natechei]
MRKIMIALGISTVLSTLVAFMVLEQRATEDQGNLQKDANAEKEDTREEDAPIRELTVGGNANSEEYISNSRLYLAHSLSASATLNQTFDTGGEPLNHEVRRSMLNGAKENLEMIVYEGEKEDKLQRAIDLIDKAIKQDNPPEPNDRVYDNQVHDILHELLEHFNGSAKDIEVDIMGNPVDEETQAH